MDHKAVEDYILSFEGAKLDYPFGKEVAVYRIGDASTSSAQAKMFALIQEHSDPVRLSLKCDPQLAVVLREKYETVMPGYHLNKKHWNTILLTGQLSWPEIQDLIRHSYNLVANRSN
jgi:predicted DNA-binding protein (MmcQ/YjbR family)